MKKILFFSLLIKSFGVLSCVTNSPCILIQSSNEYLMEHTYITETQKVYKDNGLIQIINKYLGIPYVYGGNNSSGIDCSALTKVIFEHKGILIPRTSRQQYKDHRFKKVHQNDLQEWDLVFFKKNKNSKIDHVAIYLGNNEIIHSSRKEGGVHISKMSSDSIWSRMYYSAKRLKE